MLPQMCYNRLYKKAVWNMDFMTSKEAAKIWKLTPRRVSQMCRMGYIEGVQKVGTAWIMPKDTKNPMTGGYLQVNISV